jgi:hypothetical protein
LKRVVVSVFLLLLVVAAVVPALPSRAASAPVVTLSSQYVVNRYGYAVINETVKLSNNGTSAVQIPDIQLGFGNLSSDIAGYNVTGSGYSGSTSQGQRGLVYVVSAGGQTLQPKANSTFSLKAVTYNVVSKTKNGTLAVELLTLPYLDITVNTMNLVIKMPASTQFKSAPAQYTLLGRVATNVTYYHQLTNFAPQNPLTQVSLVKQSSQQELFPLVVYSAERLVTVSPSGTPMVEDSISLENKGTTQLGTLVISPLTSRNGQVTVLPSASPPLLSPTTVLLNNGGLALSSSSVSLAADPGANLTITFQYPLDKSYYNVTAGTVNISIPNSPPLPAYVNSYVVAISTPPGVNAVGGPQQSLGMVGPFQHGSVRFSYSLSVGWGLESGLPIASFIFVLALVGLFAARAVGLGAEEEEEEESATELASDMVKAFEEKTSLINGLFEEIPAADPSQLGKTYFDELRSRLDAFRSRALQRLNELKQKSGSKRFSDLLTQIHETEREVDRAARDLLNLYEQFYTRRMRKEVFDRLLPTYKKRLEKALNQLSDELNVAQRESKLL